jgi:Spy/CpxP family protein refolding chaperone
MWKWLFLILTVPLIASAQPPRELFPWWDGPIARDLNLTDTQTKQIRAAVKEYRDRLVELRGTVQKADGDLRDVFNEDPIDQVKANAAIDRLAAARGELTKTLSQMTLKMRSALTAQQWQELQRRQPRRPGFRDPDGPGPGNRRRGPVPGSSTDLKQN